MAALLADVFPYLVAFYVADGLTFLRMRQAVIAWSVGGNRRLTPGLHLLGLAPWSEVVAIDVDPFLLLPSGLGVFDPGSRYAPRLLDPEEVEVIPWQAVGEARASGRRVLAAGRTLHTASTRSSARALAARVEALRAASPEERAREIERQIDSSADLEALEALRRKTRPLRAALAGLGTLLFALTFVVLPAALHTPLAASVPLAPLLVAIMACAVAAAALGGALLWRCGVRNELAQEILPLVVFPPGAARALPQLSRGLLARFDAAALAAALLPRAAFVAHAREELNRIRLGRERVRGSELEGWLVTRERAWRRVLEQAGLEVGEVVAAPRGTDASSRTYCPLCSTEYREGYVRCADCAVALEPVGGAGGSTTGQ